MLARYEYAAGLEAFETRANVLRDVHFGSQLAPFCVCLRVVLLSDSIAVMLVQTRARAPDDDRREMLYGEAR